MTHLRRGVIAALTVLSISALSASASSAAPSERGLERGNHVQQTQTTLTSTTPSTQMQMRDVWCC